MIDKIKLKNYKKFRDEEIIFNPGRNILVGENGVGKTSILNAISYVLSGSYSKIETVGISSLFNNGIIDTYMEGARKYIDLPVLEIELYINESIINYDINGKHNSEKRECNGLKLSISPDDDFSIQMMEALKSSVAFPFEYYKVEFLTFLGTSYNSMKRYKSFIRHSLIDTTRINSEYAIKEYVTKLYDSQGDDEKRKAINNAYRENAAVFSDELYKKYKLEESTDGYIVTLDVNHENTFKNNITVRKDGIDIKNLGQGERVFINADFSLEKAPKDLNIVLIEEPENHLSYLSMHRLIDKIVAEEDKQTFIATHSNMIAARLNLKNVIFFSDEGCIKLSELPNSHAKFFEKAPENNVLNFILAKNTILVEGSAEYIVMEEFFKHIKQCEMHKTSTALISCGGKTFKNYLVLARMLKKKTAVITDNDHDYKKNVEDNYQDYINEYVKVFAEKDNNLRTFEVVLYENNQKFYTDNIESSKMLNGVKDYMLNNKAEAALKLLNILETKTELYDDFEIPIYIKDAIEWVSK